MADLVLNVRTNWQELVELRKQIMQTESEMKKLSPESTADEIARVTQKNAELVAKYDSLMASLGRTGAYMKEAMSQINNLIASETIGIEKMQDGMINAVDYAQNRLRIEEKINETLRKKRDELKAQTSVKPSPGTSQGDVWLANVEQLTVYEELLKTSDARIADIKEKVTELSKSDYGQKALEDARIAANSLIDELNAAFDKSEAAEGAFGGWNNVFKNLKDGVSFEDINSKLDVYEQTLKDTGTAADEAFKAQEAYYEMIQKQLDEINEKKNATTDETELARLDEQAKELEVDLANTSAILEKIKEVKNAINGKTEILGDAREYAESLAAARDKSIGFVKVLGEIKFGTEEANKAFEDYATKTFSLSEEVKGSLKGIATIAGIGFGIHEVGNFVQQMAATREYFQDIESSMKVFLGNEEKSMEFTKKLKDYAWYNMFEFSDLAKASQQMIAYGQDVDSIIPRLDQLSNVASGTHAPLMEMVDAYNRAKSTGVVDANGIKSWATKGVVIRDILKEMGEHAAGTAITFEQLNKVLDHITGEGGMFHNLMGEQLNNISAEKGQLEDNLDSMFNEVGEKFQDVITRYYKLQSEMVNNYQDFVGGENVIDFTVRFAEIGMDVLMDNWKALMELIKNAIVIYGTWRVMSLAVAKAHMAYTKVIAANTLAEKINTGAIKSNTIAKGEANAATILLSKSIKGLNGTMLMSPLTWWAAGITAIVYGVYSYYSNMMTADKATRLATASMESYNEGLESEREKDKELIGVLKDKTASLYDQYKAYQDLIKQRAIFAQYTKEELANMSPEQIKTLQENDDYSKTQTRLEREIKAYQEIKQIADSVGVLDFSANIPELKERMQEIAKENYLGQEWFEQQWESIHWNTGMGRWADEMIEAVSGQLQEHLQDKSMSGIKGGLEKGIADTNIRSLVSNMINSYSGEIANSTADKGKTIAEAYKNQLLPTIKEVQERITTLNKELATASGEKKTIIQAKLDAENTTLEFLRGVMSFFEGGVTNKTLVVDIQQATQEEQVGGDFVKDLGDQYAAAELMAAKYKDALIGIQEETENTGITSQEQLDEIAARFGFTAENINHDVGEMSKQVQSEIDDLKEKYDKTSDLIEREKLKIQIEEKEKLLEYISTLQKKLLDIAKSPYTIFLNVAGNAIDFLKGLLGGKGFTMDFGLRSLADRLLGNSKKAQDAASEQRKKDAENEEKPVVSSAETYKELKANQERTKKLYDTILKNDKKNAKTYVTEEDGIFKIVKEGTKGAKVVDDEIKKRIKQGKDQAESAFREVGGDTKGNKNAGKEALQRRQKEYDQFLKEREQSETQAQKTFDANERARIASIRENGIREQEEHKNQHRLAMQNIADREEEMKKQNVQLEKEQWSNKKENKNKIWADTQTAQDVKKNGYENIKLTKDQQAEIDALRKEELAKESQYQENIQKKHAQSMRDYLKEYGTYEEQRLAITQEYEQKIKEAMDAGDTGAAASYQAEMKEKTDNLGFQQLQDNLNWDQILGDFSQYSTEYLHTLQEQLEKAVKYGMESGMDAVNLKTLTDKLQEIKEQIAGNGQGIFGSLFGTKGILGGSQWGDIYQRKQQQSQLEERARTARSNADYAQGQYVKARFNQGVAQQEYDEAVKNFGENSKQAEDAFLRLRDASDDAKDAQKTAADAAGEAAAAEAQVAGNAKGMGLAITDAIIHGVNQNLQSASTMVQEWGIGSEEFQKGFAKFAESSQYATQAFDALKSGDIAGVVYNLGNAFNSLGESFGLWSNSNREEIEKENARLAQSMDVNTEAVNRLTEEMRKQTPAEAYEKYEQALAVMQQNEKTARRIMENNEWMYDGGGSLHEDFRESGGNAVVKRILDYLGVSYQGNDPGLDALVRTDAATLNKLYETDYGRQLLQQLGEAISNAEDEGNYNGLFGDLLEYMNTYGQDAYDDLWSSFQEGVTGTSLDNFKDKWTGMLMDLSKKNKDYADDFTEQITQSFLNAQIEDKFGDRLDALYKGWADALRDDNKLTDDEIHKLKADEQQLMKEMQEERNRIFDLTGYDKIAQEQQSATYNSAQNITYEQADTIAGILTAQLIVQEQGKADTSLLTATVSQMIPLHMEQRDIAADSRDILAGMAIHVEEIRDGVVDTIVPRIKNIDNNLDKVYKLVEAQ